MNTLAKRYPHVVPLTEHPRQMHDFLRSLDRRAPLAPECSFRAERGLTKNTAQLVTLLALPNLWMARRDLLANAEEVLN